MQYIRSNDASFSIRFHSIQREEQSRRSSILGITPNNLINRGHGIASTEIGSLSSIEFIPIPKVFDRWTIMSLLNSKSFFVSIENILMQMIHKLESNFEHRSHSSWRRERVFLISFFLSLLKKKICSLSIYETIEAISLINRRITDSKRNPTISRIWMMIVQELDQLDFFRMKNLQNGPNIGTNLMRATLLLFFLYACRLGRSSIRSRWSKRSPL